MIVWNTGDRNLTCRLDWLGERYADTAATIAKLEAAAGVKGDWDYDDETGWNWWGLVGTYKGVLFTVYTHKSGTIKIGGDPDAGLDVAGLKTELLSL